MTGDTNYDPFEDDIESNDEIESDESENEEDETDESENDADESDDENEDAGEDEADETPESDEDEEENVDSDDKMIPAHRFKAALKQLTEERDKANQELATFKAPKVPNKEEDPEGYDFHNRLEISKAVMRDTHEDYDVIAAHYKTMADVNPYLNEAVAAHPIPAKYAYDLAKKDLELKELSGLKGSDEWKQFQEFKKALKGSPEKVVDPKAKVKSTSKTKVPNLNRATNVSKNSKITEDSDELFAGAL